MHPVNRLLSPLGLRMHRIPPVAPVRSNYIRLLDHFGINLILDVGAHKGLSAQTLFDHGFNGRIVSFEPIKAYFDALSERCQVMRNAGFAWESRHCALGDHDGSSVINVSGNGESSSIAAMLPTHERLSAESKYVGTEKISIRTLDAVLPEIARPEDRILLLLDVQGFEPQALAGAVHSLPRLTGVQLEVNFRPTYATGFDVPTAFKTMQQLGFTPCHVEPAWKDPDSNIVYQVDVLWFRTPDSA